MLVLIILVSVALILLKEGMRRAGEKPLAKVIVLVDNNKGAKGKNAWGFSALIEVGDLKVLFDTGPDPKLLEYNVKALGVSLEDVDFVFISHEHADHSGGLSYVASLRKGVKVFLPKGVSPGFLDRLRSMGLEPVELSEPEVLAEGVMSTGTMEGPPAEHGLIINLRSGAILITGCAHPKVERMVERAYNLTGKVYGVMGGFHLFSAPEGRLRRIVEGFKGLGIEFVAPMHCSGDKARSYFKREMPDAYADGHVGAVYTFTPEGFEVRP